MPIGRQLYAMCKSVGQVLDELGRSGGIASVATLRAMASGDDDLDAALARRVASPAAERKDRADPVADAGIDRVRQKDEATLADGFPKKALGHTALTLLRFAGKEDKSIDQFVEHAQANGIDRNRQGIRAFLFQYKSIYGLLQSQRDGYFRLSDLGIAYLASLDQGGQASSAT